MSNVQKYSMRGGIEWQIQHETKPSTVFDIQPHSSYYIFLYIRINGALTDLLFCVGGLAVGSRLTMESECGKV